MSRFKIKERVLSLSLIATLAFCIVCSGSIVKAADIQDSNFKSINDIKDIKNQEDIKSIKVPNEIQTMASPASSLYATGSTISNNTLRISTWYYYGLNRIYTMYLDNSAYYVNFYHVNNENAVYALQCSLNTLVDGSKLEVDGSFGTLTHSKLLRFQGEAGLEQDGSCGPATWRKINSLLPWIFEGKYYP